MHLPARLLAAALALATCLPTGHAIHASPAGPGIVAEAPLTREAPSESAVAPAAPQLTRAELRRARRVERRSPARPRAPAGRRASRSPRSCVGS